MKKAGLLNKKALLVIISFIVSLGFMMAIYFTGGIWFETNDDVFISEMLSGKITGVPEFHCPYVGTMITYPITLLYRILPAVPWWGIFVFSILFLSVFLNLSSFVLAAKRVYEVFLFTVITFCIFIARIHNYG